MDKDVCFNIAVIIVTLLAMLMVFQHFNIKRERFSGTVTPGDLNLAVSQTSDITSMLSNINMPSESTINTLAEAANAANTENSQDSEDSESENNSVNQEVEHFGSLTTGERAKLVPSGLNKNTIYGYTVDALLIPDFDDRNNFTLQ